MIAIVAGCVFDESGVPIPERVFDLYLNARAPYTRITNQGGGVVLHVPGRLAIHHGFHCGEARTQTFVRLRGDLRLPQAPPTEPPFNNAVVYLNGWKVTFKDAESELIGFGAAIRHVELHGGRNITWDAGGGVTGEDQGSPIEFCYWYTAVAWTARFQDIAIVEEDPLLAPASRGGTFSGLLRAPRYVQDSRLEAPAYAGVLPMGFGLWWADLEEDYLLQAAYHMAPSDRYVYGASRYGRDYSPTPTLPSASSGGITDFANHGFVSWDSSAIFKNGDAPDPYFLKDAVTAIAGSSLDMIEPHFGFSPTIQVNIAEYGQTAIDVTVENVPFHVAVPVLKGWNVYNHIDDEQVRELGIWIDSFRYVKTGGRPGVLTYRVNYTITSDESVGHTGHPAVTVLGINDVYPD